MIILLFLFIKQQACEDVLKQLQSMKYILYGTENHEPNSELVAQLAQEAYSSHVLHAILLNLHLIEFEVSVKILINYFSNLSYSQLLFEYLVRKIFTSFRCWACLERTHTPTKRDWLTYCNCCTCRPTLVVAFPVRVLVVVLCIR